MQLEFHISPGSPAPIYRQIVTQVRHAVLLGARPAGEQLPSVRALAEQLVINPNTVARAYSELVRDGVVEARAGRGYFIADRRQIYAEPERLRRLQQALDALLSDALVLNFTAEEIKGALEQRLAQMVKPAGAESGDGASTNRDARRG